jgi:hypothetical protein
MHAHGLTREQAEALLEASHGDLRAAMNAAV